MTGKALANYFPGFAMANDIIKRQANPFQFPGYRINPQWIIISKGRMVCNTHFDNGVNMAPGLDLPIGLRRIPHEGGPPQFKKPKIVGMVHQPGPIRIRVQYAG